MSKRITQMLLRIPVGVLSDRLHKRKLFIAFGLLFTALSALGLWLTEDFLLIILLRAAAGAAAATWVDFTVLFTSYYKHEEATKAIGTISFFNSLGQVLGILMAGWVSDAMGWEGAFMLGSVIGALGLIGSLFLVEHIEEDAPKITLRAIAGVAGDQDAAACLNARDLIAGSYLCHRIRLYTGLCGRAWRRKWEMSLLTCISTIPVALASLYGGRKWAARYGEKRIAVWGTVLMGVFIIMVPFTHQLPLLMLTQAISGFGRGLSFTVLMSLSIKHMPSDKRATAMGFFQAIYGLGMFIGPVLMGIIGVWFNLNQGFFVLGIIGCISALLTQWLIKDDRPRKAKVASANTISH